MPRIYFENYPRGFRIAGIIFSKSGESVALIERYKDGRHYFVFPGGGMETTDRSKKDALLREIKEETNLFVKVISQPYQIDILGHSRQFFYICRHAEGELSIVGEEEGKQSANYQYLIGWFPMADLRKKKVYPLEVRDWLLEDFSSGYWRKRKMKVSSFDFLKV
ncbi:NUDIX domain-containing protein [Candidatus Shapirobacteria bacterium]|nr:NUDIX domain-containing protein [Candidatus Shapirobacteria bacterium]